jgi:branched-chain amino acid aminotransferase
MTFLFYFGHMNHVCINGKIMAGEEPIFLAANRGFRYGDGLFETMKVCKGKILLEHYHFQRLFAGLSLMKFEISKLMNEDILKEKILQLCKKNECEKLARVRLTVFRGNGGLYDEAGNLQYIIECWPANESVNKLNENGLVIDIFPDARKSCDAFSNLKSANFLPYVMAAIFANENKLNDCLVQNTYGNIADATIANIFLIKNGIVTTPALSEGCINGVMRRYLLEKMQGSNYPAQEGVVTSNDLETADEIFLTNAMYGIRWVKQFRNKMFTNLQIFKIYIDFVQSLY